MCVAFFFSRFSLLLSRLVLLSFGLPVCIAMRVVVRLSSFSICSARQCCYRLQWWWWRWQQHTTIDNNKAQSLMYMQIDQWSYTRTHLLNMQMIIFRKWNKTEKKILHRWLAWSQHFTHSIEWSAALCARFGQLMVCLEYINTKCLN